MYIKNLSLIVCLLTSTLLFATHVPETNPVFTPSNDEGGLCNLPAPTDFKIVETGTSWVRYAWAGNTMLEHRIRTYRASDNTLLNTTIVPAGIMNVVVDNLPSGTGVYGVINARCHDGSDSPNTIESGQGVTLIVELLVNGVRPTQEPSTCMLVGNGSCILTSGPGNLTPFMVSKSFTNEFRMFGMIANKNSVTSVTLQDSNSIDGSKFDFKCSGADPSPRCSGPMSIEIWYTGNNPPVLIGLISASRNLPNETNFLEYYAMEGVSGFQIDRTDGGGDGIATDPPTGLHSKQPENSAVWRKSISAAPNPFSETLDVYPNYPDAENVHVQLFNLSGQKVLDQQFAGGEEQYTLSTATLANGFYLLRIEADGETQTLKVVKSE